jgi:hypothetical protein
LNVVALASKIGSTETCQAIFEICKSKKIVNITYDDDKPFAQSKKEDIVPVLINEVIAQRYGWRQSNWTVFSIAIVNGNTGIFTF